MAKEILAVPEQHLADTIKVIRAGLNVASGMKSIHPSVIKNLTEWCDSEEEYLKDLL